MADRLYAAGVAVNRVGVPGVRGAAFRLSSAEVTRCGATEADSTELADIIADVVVDGAPTDRVASRAAALRARLYRPRYCFEDDALEDPAVPEWLRELAAAVGRGVYGEDR